MLVLAAILERDAQVLAFFKEDGIGMFQEMLHELLSSIHGSGFSLTIAITNANADDVSDHCWEVLTRQHECELDVDFILRMEEVAKNAAIAAIGDDEDRPCAAALIMDDFGQLFAACGMVAYGPGVRGWRENAEDIRVKRILNDDVLKGFDSAYSYEIAKICGEVVNDNRIIDGRIWSDCVWGPLIFNG